MYIMHVCKCKLVKFDTSKVNFESLLVDFLYQCEKENLDFFTSKTLNK